MYVLKIFYLEKKYFDRDTGYIFSILRARTAASCGRVRPRDATASARATRNPAYAGPGFWLFISLWTQCPGQKRRPDSESAWKTGLETSFGTDQNKKKKNLEVALRCPVQY